MKGSLLDMPVIMALLLSGAISIFVVYFILSAISANWITDVTGATESKAILTTGITAVTMFDQGFIILAVGLGCFSIVSAFFIDNMPGLYILSVLLLLPIILVTSAQISNAFYAFATSEPFIAVGNTFPMISYLMINLPLFMLGISMLVAIVIHGKPQSVGI